MTVENQFPVPQQAPRSISIALLTCNRAAHLARCVGQILPQLKPGDEIIILDTGSTDATQEYLKDVSHLLRWESLDSESGADFGAARNALIRMSRCEAIAFTDDDCIPETDWLDRIRINLAAHHAVGGACLPMPDLPFPRWWHPDLNWTVGLSTPGFLAREPHSYPATSNLAAWKTVFDAIPFEETPYGLGSEKRYLGGREDATWWRQIRCGGYITVVDPKQRVIHDIPESRLSYKYVSYRAISDGFARWHREQNWQVANSLPFGVQTALIGLMKAAFRFRLRDSAAAWVWLMRQDACVAAARTSGDPRVHERISMKHFVQSGLEMARPVVIGMGRRIRCLFARPLPAAPSHAYISAESHLGDSLLLRPLIEAYAQSLPDRALSVCARYPEVFVDMPPNAKLVREADQQAVADAAASADLALVPYFAHGSQKLWRSRLSSIARTFDWEVGFRSQTDYARARVIVRKNASVHEMRNLANLFGMDSMQDEMLVPRLDREKIFADDLQSLLPALDTGKPYAILQLGSGWPHKAPTAARWLEALASVRATFEMQVVIIGSAEEHAAAEDFRRHDPALIRNICNPFPVSQLLELIRNASLVIGSCSAPKHIAMAFDVPTFTAYTITEPERWGDLLRRPIHGYLRALAGPLTHEEHLTLEPEHIANLITAKRLEECLMQHADELQSQGKWPFRKK